MSELEKQIELVRDARIKAEEASGVKRAAYEKWQQDSVQIIESAESTKELVLVEEEKLRELTIEAFKETGSKKPAEGVGIRETINYIYESKDAFGWAMEHKMAVKLDEKAFKDIAKVTPLDFVTKTTSFQVPIATDL